MARFNQFANLWMREKSNRTRVGGEELFCVERGGACFDVSVRGCGEQKLRENYFQTGQVEKCGKFISR